jgi:flavin-binding protein dodecin
VVPSSGRAFFLPGGGWPSERGPRAEQGRLLRIRTSIAFSGWIMYFHPDSVILGSRIRQPGKEGTMSVARVTEITSSSTKSFDDAIQIGISRANKTLQNVKGAWIQDQKVVVEGGKITEYRVNMKVTFVLKA